MKIAYRIVTPVLAAGTIAMGILLKMFNFTISALNSEQLGGSFGFSIIDAIKRLGSLGGTEESSTTFADVIEIVKPMLPSAITFFVLLILAFLVLIAIIFVAALSDNRKPTFILSGAGLVLLFVAIIVSKVAFGMLTDGETIAIADLITAFSSSSLFALAASFVSVSSATLSAGFFAMFGMFILILLWLVVVGYVIKSPIQPKKREYRRKKPMRKIVRKAK